MLNDRYRTTENITLPFKVRATINEATSTRVEFKIAIKANYSSKLFAQNMIVKIPTPLNTASTKTQVNGGKAKYSGSENCFIWK